jgi:hypothetical protein
LISTIPAQPVSPARPPSRHLTVPRGMLSDVANADRIALLVIHPTAAELSKYDCPALERCPRNKDSIFVICTDVLLDATKKYSEFLLLSTVLLTTDTSVIQSAKDRRNVWHVHLGFYLESS